jgi:hypothetical protein
MLEEATADNLNLKNLMAKIISPETIQRLLAYCSDHKVPVKLFDVVDNQWRPKQQNVDFELKLTLEALKVQVSDGSRTQVNIEWHPFLNFAF